LTPRKREVREGFRKGNGIKQGENLGRGGKGSFVGEQQGKKEKVILLLGWQGVAKKEAVAKKKKNLATLPETSQPRIVRWQCKGAAAQG